MHGRALLTAMLLVAAALPSAAAAAPDAGETPVGLVWSATDPARTPALIAPADAAPAGQRVVYGVADLTSGARVVVRTLEKPGAEVGPATTLAIDDLGGDPAAFGTQGGVEPVAGPGRWAIVAHNDNGRVEIARVDVAAATADRARGEEEYVLPGSAGCRVDAAPLSAYGALWLVTAGPGCATLWRIPVGSEAALGAAERLDVAGLDAFTPPAAVAIGGRPHVAVAAGSTLVHVPAEGALAAGPTTALPDGDLPRAPLAVDGELYVAARTAAGTTRIHRLRPSDGSVLESGAVFGGAPGPTLAGGAGRLVATSSAGVHVVELPSLQPRPAAVTDPHERTAATVLGTLAYVASDAGSTEVLRLPTGERVAAADFDRAQVGAATGAPATARGYVVFTGAGGVAVHRSRDVTAPEIELLAPGRARAADARGVTEVQFRLARSGGVPQVATTASEPASGNPFSTEGAEYAGDLGDPARGTYLVDAVAIDAAGNRAVSGRLTLRVGKPGARRGRCANRLAGSPRMDVLRGTRAGDRLRGRRGDDALRGGAGDDCLDGGGGADAVSGGRGADRITGGPGRDRIRCGPGRDRVRADARDRVARDCERVRRR